VTCCGRSPAPPASSISERTRAVGEALKSSRKGTGSGGAERASQLDRARWEAVLATARDGIVSIDAEGRVRLFNRSAEQIFGYAADEVIGSPVNLLMPSPYRQEHDEYLRRYRETGVPRAIGRIRSVAGQRKNGEVFPVELSVSEASAGGEVIYTAIVRDVSERQRAEAELRELQRVAQQRERLADVGAITAKIIHEVGNPLAALSLQVQLVRRRLQRDPSAPLGSIAPTVDQIHHEAKRLEGLVHELMAFPGEQRLDIGPIELNRYLGEVVDGWRPFAAPRRIELRVEVARGVGTIPGDAEKLRRVFDNLLKNAIEAIDHGPGEVIVRARLPRDGKLRILVEDSGPGISDRIQLFHLFETTKPNGTGLGLAVAKEIVLAHGGEIGFTKREPQGTIFQVDLPCDAEAL
jgi:two-component system sensor kinase FixL